MQILIKYDLKVTSIDMDNERFVNDFPVLSKTETNTLFLSTLSDVYNLKKHLANYLPALAQKASYAKLRLTVMNQILDLEKEIFNLNLIFKTLKYDNQVRPQGLKGELDIEEYITCNLDKHNPYQTDFIILSHLIMISHMEVGYYRILQSLTHGVNHKAIVSLVKDCLTMAIRTKKSSLNLTQAFKVEA